LEIREKPGVFRFSYQLHSSLADCAKELFKPSKDSASLQVCNEKKIFGFGFHFFWEWRRKWEVFGHFWWLVSDLSPTARWKYFTEVFMLETRLESASFDTLIYFLTFLVQKLW